MLIASSLNDIKKRQRLQLLRSRSISVDPLSRWRANYSVAGKRVTLWGDSTTQVAGTMWDAITNQMITPGGEWAGATAINLGMNGQTMAGALAGIGALFDTNPDKVILCFGLNDVRLGAPTLPEMTARISDSVDAIQLNLPNCDILLWTPNSMLSTDPTGSGFVNPVASAQAYTDVMWNAYNNLIDYKPHVASLDKMDVFGRICQATSPLMQDILHPNGDGQIKALIPMAAFTKPKAPPLDLTRSALAWNSNPANPHLVYSRALEDTRYCAKIAGFRINVYLDLGGNNLLIYAGPRFNDIDVPPEIWSTDDWIWTPNGVYKMTGNENKGALGNNGTSMSGISLVDFPPNSPPLGNAILYRRV